MGYTKEVKERSFDLVDEGWYTAKLLSVTPKQVGSGTKLKWKFEILEGDFKDKYVWGDIWDNLDQSDACTWRRWHEALIERPVSIGENIDTDDVINYMAQIHVTHRFYYKDKIEDEEHKVWVAEVADDPSAVLPVSAALPDEAPF